MKNWNEGELSKGEYLEYPDNIYSEIQVKGSVGAKKLKFYVSGIGLLGNSLSSNSKGEKFE